MLKKTCLDAPRTGFGRLLRFFFLVVGFASISLFAVSVIWFLGTPIAVETVQASEIAIDGKFIVGVNEDVGKNYIWQINQFYVVPEKFQGQDFKVYQDSIATAYQIGRLDFLTVALSVIAAIGATAAYYGAVEVRKRVEHAAESEINRVLQDEVDPQLDKTAFYGLLRNNGGGSTEESSVDDFESEPKVD